MTPATVEITFGQKGERMPRQRTIEEERIALDKALEEFTNDMRARLYEKLEKGYRRWDDPDYAPHIASDLLKDAIAVKHKGDRLHMHDIANRAMMLWWQAWRLKGCPK